MDEEQRNRIKKVAIILILIYYYYITYVDRTPRRKSSYTGDKWVGKLLRGRPTRFFNMFRMTKEIFLDLLNELQNHHGLVGSSRTTSREVLAITLYILSQNESIRGATERFRHSSETISRYFSAGLRALISLASKIIKPEDPTFQFIPTLIANDPRYMPFFKDCIGVIDGIHIDARISDRMIAFAGPCGSPTQNVMAVCDFNMCFTFAIAGWEGSASDNRIFKCATRDPRQNFPYPPPGKYYLIDNGYLLQRGYLKPYSDTNDHITDFERSNGVTRNRKKLFNKRHSSLHGVIERAFGVWKKKWVILRDMPNYPFPKQVQIVLATMTLHNFIRRHHSRVDADFTAAEDDRLQTPPEAFEFDAGSSVPQLNLHSQKVCTREGEGASEMTNLREQIAEEITLSCDYDSS